MLFAPVVVLLLSHLLNPMRRATAADVVRHRNDFPASAAVLGRPATLPVGAAREDIR
jgi:hypothetical protein